MASFLLLWQVTWTVTPKSISYILLYFITLTFNDIHLSMHLYDVLPCQKVFFRLFKKKISLIFSIFLLMLFTTYMNVSFKCKAVNGKTMLN